MSTLVYIYGLGPGKFRVPNPSGGQQSVTEKNIVQVDLDDEETQAILWGEKWHYIRVAANNSTTATIMGLTRKGFRILDNTSGLLKTCKVGTPLTVDLTNPVVRRVLRRNEGRYIVVTTDTAVAIRGIWEQQGGGFDVSAKVAATATLASTGTNPSVADTVTIENVTYRFESTLAAANDVKIGATSDATLDSLVKAVNQTGTVGTDYFTGTVAPTDVTAGARSGTGATATVVFTAKTPGTGGNAYPSTETSAQLSFSNGTTFTGGAESGALTKVYKGVTTTVDATVPAVFTKLRRFFRHWVEA